MNAEATERFRELATEVSDRKSVVWGKSVSVRVVFGRTRYLLK